MSQSLLATIINTNIAKVKGEDWCKSKGMEIPTCAENGCSQPCSVKMVGAKESEDWGKTEYSNHKYHWNLCDECYEEEEEEEPEPYCFKDTTKDTVDTDVCFCSVGGCVKPTEFDESEDEYSSDDEEVGYCGSCETELDYMRDGTDTNGHRCSDCYWEQESRTHGEATVVEYLSDDEEGIPFEHTSAIRQVNIEIKNRFN